MLLSIKKEDLSVERLLLLSLLTFSVISVIAQLYNGTLLPLLFKPVVAVFLVILYVFTSKVKNVLFFIFCFFLLIITLFMSFSFKGSMLYGVVSVLLFRIFIVFYITKLTSATKVIPILLAAVPFLSVFSYLLSISEGLPVNSFEVIVAQNILVSVAAGVVFWVYLRDELKQNSVWLFIFGLLYVALYFLLLIVKCFLANFPLTDFEPLIMILHLGCYFSFYKYVIDTEQKAQNTIDLK